MTYSEPARVRRSAWLAREMTTEEGAFCASLDADSEGEEGKFYVWSLAEIEAVLGKDDAAFFAARYDVTREGNFEGHNILNRLKHLPRNMEDESRLAPLREKLLAARAATGAPRTRRQGPGRLERADDCGPRQCRRGVR